MSLSLSNMLRVRVGAEQPLQFFGVFELHLDHPPLAVGIAIHERRVLLQCLVCFYHGTSDGRKQLRHRLNGLDRPEDVVLLERGCRFGQLDEHDVSQLPLRVVGDADLHDLRIVALAHPLVVLCVAEVFWNARHGCGAYNRSARGASPAPSSSLRATRVSPHGLRSSRTATGSGSGDRWYRRQGRGGTAASQAARAPSAACAVATMESGVTAFRVFANPFTVVRSTRIPASR